MQIVTFTAARDIQAGEELTFYYGSNLWFKDCEAEAESQNMAIEPADDDASFLAAYVIGSEWERALRKSQLKANSIFLCLF